MEIYATPKKLSEITLSQHPPSYRVPSTQRIISGKSSTSNTSIIQHIASSSSSKQEPTLHRLPYQSNTQRIASIASRIQSPSSTASSIHSNTRITSITSSTSSIT